MTLRTATMEAVPEESSPSDLGEAMVHAVPPVESPPPDLDGVQSQTDAHASHDPANLHALAVQAVKGAPEVKPTTIAKRTFDDLELGALRELAFRAWVFEVRRVVGEQRRDRGGSRTQSPAWKAVAHAHDVGRLDAARWSINGEWVQARDLTLEQVGKLTSYYRQQQQAFRERKERFVALHDAMRKAGAKKASDLGEEQLAALLFA